MSNDKQNYAILAIVAIVAIVGVICLIIGYSTGKASGSISTVDENSGDEGFANDLTGQAINIGGNEFTDIVVIKGDGNNKVSAAAFQLYDTTSIGEKYKWSIRQAGKVSNSPRGSLDFISYNEYRPETGETRWKEIMTVTNDGKLGLGTTNPAKKLDVNGTANIGGGLYLGDLNNYSPLGEHYYLCVDSFNKVYKSTAPCR